MDSYSIEWKSSAAGELKKLDKAVFHRVLESVKSLSANPRPMGVRKLTGAENAYRIRCGNYRIVYTIQDRKLMVEIIRIGHRSNIYKI